MRADVAGRPRTGPAVFFALAFVTLAVGLALIGPRPTAEQWTALALLLPLYVLALRTEFAHGISASVPTQPFLVGMFLLVPPEIIPLCLAVAHLVDGCFTARSVMDWAANAFTGWFCLGPVLVLVIAQPDALAWHNWWIYLAALLAQFVLDLTAGVSFELLMSRPPEGIIRPLLWGQALDVCLSVIAFCAVVAADGSLWSVPLLAAPVAMVALMIQDRQALATDRRSLDEEVTQVRSEARVDQLTGLGNRRAWEEGVAEAEHRLTIGAIRCVGVVMADLNDLKLVNDSRGHEAGDELLRTMGRLFAATAPDGATTARIGGDEFAMLIPDPGLTGTQDVIRRLQAAFAAHPGVDGVGLSAAVGGANHPPSADLAQAVTDADAAALAAKRSRRRQHRSDPRLPSPRRSHGDRLSPYGDRTDGAPGHLG